MSNLVADLRPYQRKGIRMMLDRFNGKSLNADDMGLGKTIQSLAVIDRLHERTLIVCPSPLKYNWVDEFKKFLPSVKPYVCSGQTPAVMRKLDRFQVYICNYEIVQYWRDTFIALGVKLLICDESHYVKSSKSLRYKAVKAISLTCEHRILLTGTPIENQPAELWAQLQIIDKDMFPSWLLFIKRYNGARRSRWGWQLKKATNAPELNQILLEKVMVRRKKTEVLKELPEKNRVVIPLEIDNWEQYLEAEKNIIAWLRENTRLNLDKAKKGLAMIKIEKLKLISGLGKLKQIINWANEESQNQKLVVFCHHIQVLDHLRKGLKNCVIMDAETKGEQRQKLVHVFQEDPKIRVFLSTLRVGGTGHTLHAAHTTIHCQLDWNPQKHSQAEDRVLRIGQTAKEVTNYYFIAKDTIEEKIINLLDLKRQNSSSVIDGEDQKESEMLTNLLQEMIK